MDVFTLEAKKSNLTIGEATGGHTTVVFLLFCRYSLAGSCFDDSVIQKVQETIGRKKIFMLVIKDEGFFFC